MKFLRILFLSVFALASISHAQTLQEDLWLSGSNNRLSTGTLTLKSGSTTIAESGSTFTIATGSTFNVPDAVFSIAKTNGLQTALDAKRAHAAYLTHALRDTNQASLTGLPTIDGATLVAGQTVLLVAQSTASQNGPWVVASGAWTRPTWYPAGGTLQAFYGATIFVRQGESFGGTNWQITTTAPITIGTTGTAWAIARATNGSQVPVYVDDWVSADNLQDFADGVNSQFGYFNDQINIRPTNSTLNARIAYLLEKESITQDGTSIAYILPPVTTDVPVDSPFTVSGWVSFPTGTTGTDVTLPFESDGGGFNLYVGPISIGADRKSVLGGGGAINLPYSDSFFFCYVKYANQTSKIYRDGAAVPMIGTVDINGYNFLGQYIGRAGSKAGVRFARLSIFNFALTDAEVLDLHVNRQGAIRPEWKGGSTNIPVGTFAADNYGAGYAYPNFTGGSITGFSSGVSTSDNIATAPNFIQLRKGQKYLISFTATGTLSGSGSVGLWGNYFAGTANAPFVIGSNKLTVTASDNSLARVVFVTNSPGANYAISNFKLQALGALFVMDDGSRHAGYQIADTSGGRHHVVLPPSGFVITAPDPRGGQIHGSLSWAGTHEAKSLFGQIVLSPNSVIRSITVKASAASSGSGITIGTTNSATRYVAATTYTTAKKALTLANVLPAASAAGDLDLVIDPDTSNYTGTIDVSVSYDLTTGNP